MKRQVIVALLTAMMVAVGCSKEFVEQSGAKDGQLMATIEQFDETRFAASDEALAGGTISFKWEPGDAMGVFTDAGENNIKYVNSSSVASQATTFVPTVSVSGTPTYAYYPYSADAGEDITALKGNIPATSTINSELTTIPGIYRRGTYKSTTDGLSTFGFRQLFATVRFQIDATDTKLAGCRVKSVKLVARRSIFRSVALNGDFTFNAEDASFSTSNTSNTMVWNFEGYPTLENSLTFVTSMFPNIKKYDQLYFTVTAVGYTATFTVSSSVAMAANGGYTFSLPMDDYRTLRVATNKEVYVEPETPEEDPEDPEAGSGTEGEGGDGTEGGGTEGGEGTEGDGTEGTEPETPETPTTTTGSFTCATYNVDGLPDISYLFSSINPDGPGSSGTTSISQKIATQGWDFVGFSEDFSYNTELMSSLSSAYTFGTHRGTVSSSNLTSRADTDGLQFATRKTTCSFLSESWTQFTSEAGGLTSGANTCIAKGFRHYPVQLADGVVVDVIITHMNTYSSSGTSHINAQHAQLTQIAQYINTTMAANNRPIIFMGDTNCRYTRHDFATYFWGKLDSGLTYADPWVEYQWNGVYPTYPSNSLMVSDATGTSDTDIICENTQKGEVVDKVIYINKEGNAVQLKADSYLRDYDNFNGLADHMPIVVKFTWTKTN